MRASRVLGADRLDTRVGPISVEIVKPMRTMRIRVEHRELRAELEFHGRAAPIEEPRFTRRPGGRRMLDLTRFTQHGGYSGTIIAGGKTYRAEPTRVWGARDRSWGIRPLGPRDPAGVPETATPQFFWLWSPTNFEDVCTHFDVMENADGSRRHQFGAIVKAADLAAPVEVANSVDWKIDFATGTRHAKRAEIAIRAASGDYRVELEPLYNFYMQAIGYGHPKWGHGFYVGHDVSTYESFKLADVSKREPLNQHIQAVCRARLGAREGIGILEMMIIGPHHRSGFKELLDMHA
ncbi:MAG TPA: hypothetical protein VEF03_01175 [Candidatus Binataceae bacterium]|nr:hypothetical protein [Candidatus Binataceae bacterium]